MVLCKNGHPNPEGATYCRVCRVYIDANAPHVEPEPEPVPVATPADPPPPQPAPPEVSLSETSLQAGPGTEAKCEVHLQNPGAVDDEYTVEVRGEAAAWALVDPFHLSLTPGAAATAWVTFRPEAGAEAARAVPFEVRVTSKRLVEQPVSVLGVLQLTGAPSPAPPVPAPPVPEPEPDVPAATTEKPKRHLVRKFFGAVCLLIAVVILIWALTH